MRMLTSCCGCLPLSHGAVGCAIYTMVLGVIELIIYGITLYEVQILEDGDPANGGIYRMTKIILYVTIAIILLWIVFAVLLIAGTNMKIRGMLVPWMILTGILTVLLTISVARLIANGLAFSNFQAILRLIITIIIILVDIYAVMVVASFFKARCEDVGESSGKVNTKSKSDPK